VHDDHRQAVGVRHKLYNYILQTGQLPHPHRYLVRRSGSSFDALVVTPAYATDDRDDFAYTIALEPVRVWRCEQARITANEASTQHDKQIY